MALETSTPSTRGARGRRRAQPRSFTRHRIASADPYLHEVSPAAGARHQGRVGRGRAGGLRALAARPRADVERADRARAARPHGGQTPAAARRALGGAAHRRAPGPAAGRSRRDPAVRGARPARAPGPRPGPRWRMPPSSSIAHSPRRCPSCAPRVATTSPFASPSSSSCSAGVARTGAGRDARQRWRARGGDRAPRARASGGGAARAHRDEV